MPLKHDRKWWILFVTTTATSLFLIDSTIMPVALPIIETDLDFSQVGVLWVVNAYLLSLTTFLLIGGRLSELFGYRSLYNIGLVIFGAGSLMGALSSSDWMLISARGVQGIGAALTYPAIIALLIAVFPVNQRARALGIDTGIASLFMMLGPLIGGALTEYLNWRYIFWINIPFVVFGLGMSIWLLKPTERVKERFPYFGSLVMMGGIFLFVYGLMQGSKFGWSSPWIIAFLILGPVLLALFVMLSLRDAHPLADFRLLRNRLFLGATVTRFLLYIMVTATVFWIIFFEKYLSYTPLEVGILIVASTVPVLFMAPIGGYLADRIGYRLPMTIGHLLVIFAFIWVICFATTEHVLVFLPGLLAFGGGIPMVMSPSIALGLSAISADKLGSGSGMMIATRQLASTIGVAVMTAVYTTVFAKTNQSYPKTFAITTGVALGFGVLGLIFTLWLINRRPDEPQPHSHLPPRPEDYSL